MNIDQQNNLSALDNIYNALEQKHRTQYLDLELRVLGSTLLKDGVSTPVICQYLTADDFIDKKHAVLFTAITALYSQGTPPTLTGIYEWLKSNNYAIYDDKGQQTITDVKGKSAGYVTENLIMDLGQAAFTDAYVDTETKILAKASFERKILKSQIKAINDVFDDRLTPEQVLNNTQKALDQFTESTAPKKTNNVAGYLKDDNGNYERCSLFKYFENFHRFTTRKTGFDNLDEKQIFPPSVQVIGGTPGTGKTTFCWQLANQFAERGEQCIYFSFEMSADELHAKTIAMEDFKFCQNNNLRCFTALEIRSGVFWEILKYSNDKFLRESSSAILDYVFPRVTSKYKNVDIIECEDETIEDILRMVRPYCQAGYSPIVFIDYLQLISPTDPKLNETEYLKIVMKHLKRFSVETDTTFILISALNRESYSGGDTLKGFRGTSAIEFSCDAAYILNLDFDAKVTSAEKAKKKVPRDIKLKCLKSRFGNDFEIFFKYYSASDYFEPAAADENTDAYDAESTVQSDGLPTEEEFYR